jgi:anti-sigma factor RsiW
MTLDRNNSTREPTPEQLAAYYDGALQGTERAALDAWLTEHSRDDLETAQQLDELVRATTAPEPSPQAWAGVLDRIAAGRIPTAPPRSRRRLLLRLALGLSAAAAVLGAFVLARGSTGLPERGVEPFPVVSGKDVVVIQIDGNDTSLVAAPIPIDEIGPLAEPGDVEVLEPPADPAGLMQVQGAAPMLIDPWATLARGP